MKKYIPNIVTIIMIVMLLTSISTMVFASESASDSTFIDWSGINAPERADEDAKDITDKVSNVAENALWIAQVIGYGVATIILVVLAIKYLMASPNERAEIKKSATIWVVGAVILFAGSGILTVIYNFSKTIGE